MRGPLTARLQATQRGEGPGFSRVKKSSRVKVIRRFERCRRRPARGPAAARLRYCDSLRLSGFWRPILTPDGHVVAMNDAEFQVHGAGDPRLAAYASEPPARMAVDGRRQADPVGQSGRRADVWRGRCRSACRKNLRTGRSAPAADRAARKPIAGKRRHPAGAAAGLWRGARRACDLRLLRGSILPMAVTAS